MRKFVLAALAATALSAPAFAQDTMKSDTMKSDTMKSDAMSSDTMSSDAMHPDAMSSDGMKSDAMAMEGDMMTMMKSGQVMAVMPDGHMGTTASTDDAMMANMMKHGKPVEHCMLFMTGADGKTMMMEATATSTMAECEKIAK